METFVNSVNKNKDSVETPEDFFESVEQVAGGRYTTMSV